MKDFDVNQLPCLNLEAGMADVSNGEALNGGVRAVVHSVIASAIDALV
ncbi:hypothetical protein GCM10007973_12590 [Polymorphobacter multimanifer]|uniref:Uncharacterized protein n=1 Tax=Polymorphobacter multimanifer TaxID=1070431 RepID=A0A841LDF1_9SPHN|nr:hypothetical protein [Polymorphobacter multimanifer]MBB6229033.1 hypothetical protein [Polymorphobacter multimanifer]GGI77163.1 hypothetical protein GCM10007973_12590 [Polymorphobacter multimanifer]